MKIHVFNPEHDLALAEKGVLYSPPARVVKMTEQLDALPFWWAQQGDAILVHRPKVCADWAQHLPLSLPQVEWCQQLSPYIIKDETLPDFAPWGWDATVVHHLKKAGADALPLQDGLPSQAELLKLKQLSGRQLGALCLNHLLERAAQQGVKGLGGERWVCLSEPEAAERLQCATCAIFKAPWSGSGKGLRLGTAPYAPPLQGWCAKVLQRQGAVIVEPYYNKVEDFALEFTAHKGVVTFQGLSLFENAALGAYACNCIGAWTDKRKRVEEACNGVLMHWLMPALREFLQTEIAPYYDGPLGVDMMLCQADEGLWLHPCVEINLRTTMGWVAVALEKRLAPGVKARFGITYYPSTEMLQQALQQYARECPPQVEDGLIKGGYWSLVPHGEEAHFQAYLHCE